MSRRRGSPRGSGRRGFSGLPFTPEPFVITGVSPVSGRAAGGQVITVFATGIVGTPTSTLGTVSNVSANSFQVTVNAHAAGAVTWHANNGDAGSTPSANQTYTYLAPPSGITAGSHARQTIATTVTFTVTTGLPAIGSDCPVSITVDGNACSAVTLLTLTTVSALVPTDTSAGAKNVVVTVDTVAGTGTGALTYDPPPSEISATQVGTGGGSGTITGSDFVNGATASASINGTPTSLTIAFVDAATLTFALAAGSYTASSGSGWPLTVTNPDGQSTTASIFVITSFMTPQTIWGANVRARLIADNATTNVNGVNLVPDSSSHANDFTGSSTTEPSLNSADADFNGHKSVQHNGTTQFLTNAAFSLGTSKTIWIYAVCKTLGGSTGTVFQYTNPTKSVRLNQFSTASSSELFGTATVTNSTIVPLNTGTSVVGGTTHGVTNDTVGLFVDGLDSGTATGATGNVADGQAAFIGILTGGLTPWQGKWAEIGIIDRAPTAAEVTQFCQYATSVYQVTPAPQFTDATAVLANTANGKFRISGVRFLAGVTVSCTIAGVTTALTVSSTASGRLEVTGFPSTAAGTLVILTITNPDQQTVTVSGFPKVLAADTPMIVLEFDTSGWFEFDADSVTPASPPLVNGGAISGLKDKSLKGNDAAEASGASQPTWTAADANFSSVPTGHFPGSPVRLSRSSFVLNTAAGQPLFVFAVVRIQTTANASSCICTYGNTDRLDYSGTVGKPVMEWTVPATWGSDVRTLARAVYGYLTGTASSGTVAVNVSNGTEVTAAVSSGINVAASNTFGIGVRGDLNASTYAIMDLACLVIAKVKPSSGQLSRLEAYAQTKFGVP